MYSCCHSSKKKQFISRIFSHHGLLEEKRKDTWIYEDHKNAKNTSKNRLKTVDLYLPKLVKGDDVTELCLASSTRPRRRNLLAALAQYTVSHFRSSSTKLSSCSLMFASKRMFWPIKQPLIYPVWSSCIRLGSTFAILAAINLVATV